MEDTATNVLDSFLETVSVLFHSFLDWILDFLFSGFDALFNLGRNVTDKLFSMLSGHLNSGDIIYFFIGVVVLSFAVKLFIHVVRG